MAEWVLREGGPEDVPAAMEMVRGTPWLTCHTEHSYWVVFTHLHRFVVVAELPGRGPIGFISGIPSTRDPELLFVWQLVVAPDYRGSRLAWDLLSKLLDGVAVEAGLTYVEAAMDPGNGTLMRSLQGWMEATGRAWGPREKITYETSDGTGGTRPVSELIFVLRRRRDPLAAGLGRRPEDWDLEAFGIAGTGPASAAGTT